MSPTPQSSKLTPLHTAEAVWNPATATVASLTLPTVEDKTKNMVGSNASVRSGTSHSSSLILGRHQSVQNTMAMVLARKEARAAIDDSSRPITTETAMAAAMALVQVRRQVRKRLKEATVEDFPSFVSASSSVSAKEQWHRKQRTPLSPKRQLQGDDEGLLSIVSSMDSKSSNQENPKMAEQQVQARVITSAMGIIPAADVVVSPSYPLPVPQSVVGIPTSTAGITAYAATEPTPKTANSIGRGGIPKSSNQNTNTNGATMTTRSPRVSRRRGQGNTTTADAADAPIATSENRSRHRSQRDAADSKSASGAHVVATLEVKSHLDCSSINDAIIVDPGYTSTTDICAASDSAQSISSPNHQQGHRGHLDHNSRRGGSRRHAGNRMSGAALLASRHSTNHNDTTVVVPAHAPTNRNIHRGPEQSDTGHAQGSNSNLVDCSSSGAQVVVPTLYSFTEVMDAATNHCSLENKIASDTTSRGGTMKRNVSPTDSGVALENENRLQTIGSPIVVVPGHTTTTHSTTKTRGGPEGAAHNRGNGGDGHHAIVVSLVSSAEVVGTLTHHHGTVSVTSPDGNKGCQRHAGSSSTVSKALENASPLETSAPPVDSVTSAPSHRSTGTSSSDPVPFPVFSSEEFATPTHRNTDRGTASSQSSVNSASQNRASSSLIGIPVLSSSPGLVNTLTPRRIGNEADSVTCRHSISNVSQRRAGSSASEKVPNASKNESHRHESSALRVDAAPFAEVATLSQRNTGSNSNVLSSDGMNSIGSNRKIGIQNCTFSSDSGSESETRERKYFCSAELAPRSATFDNAPSIQRRDQMNIMTSLLEERNGAGREGQCSEREAVSPEGEMAVDKSCNAPSSSPAVSAQTRFDVEPAKSTYEKDHDNISAKNASSQVWSEVTRATKQDVDTLSKLHCMSSESLDVSSEVLVAVSNYIDFLASKCPPGNKVLPGENADIEECLSSEFEGVDAVVFAAVSDYIDLITSKGVTENCDEKSARNNEVENHRLSRSLIFTSVSDTSDFMEIADFDTTGTNDRGFPVPIVKSDSEVSYRDLPSVSSLAAVAAIEGLCPKHADELASDFETLEDIGPDFATKHIDTSMTTRPQTTSLGGNQSNHKDRSEALLSTDINCDTCDFCPAEFAPISVNFDNIPTIQGNDQMKMITLVKESKSATKKYAENAVVKPMRNDAGKEGPCSEWEAVSPECMMTVDKNGNTPSSSPAVSAQISFDVDTTPSNCDTDHDNISATFVSSQVWSEVTRATEQDSEVFAAVSEYIDLIASNRVTENCDGKTTRNSGNGEEDCKRLKSLSSATTFDALDVDPTILTQIRNYIDALPNNSKDLSCKEAVERSDADFEAIDVPSERLLKIEGYLDSISSTSISVQESKQHILSMDVACDADECAQRSSNTLNEQMIGAAENEVMETLSTASDRHEFRNRLSTYLINDNSSFDESKFPLVPETSGPLSNQSPKSRGKLFVKPPPSPFDSGKSNSSDTGSAAQSKETQSAFLVGYLSKQVAKNGYSLQKCVTVIGIDPPTLLESISGEHCCKKSDPPLHLTPSEEIRVSCEPEANLKKKSCALPPNDGCGRQFGAFLDPELQKPPMFDVSGEPVKSAPVVPTASDEEAGATAHQDQHESIPDDNGLPFLPAIASAGVANDQTKNFFESNDQQRHDRVVAAFDETPVDCDVELVRTASNENAATADSIDLITMKKRRERKDNNILIQAVTKFDSSNTDFSIELIRATSSSDGKNDDDPEVDESVSYFTDTDRSSELLVKALEILSDAHGASKLWENGKPPVREKVTSTSSSKVTVLIIPNATLEKRRGASIEEKKDDVYSGQDTCHGREQIMITARQVCDKVRMGIDPDGICPAKVARDCDEAVKNLFPRFAGSGDVSDYELYSFGQLVRFSFPSIIEKEPTSLAVSQILTHAKDLNISLDIVDRFLETSQLMDRESMAQRSSARESSGRLVHYDDNEILSFLHEMLQYLEEHEKQADAPIDDLMSRSRSKSENGVEAHDELRREYAQTADDAVEVEVHDGYVSKEYAPRADDESWWEVVARLNGVVIDVIPESNKERSHEVSTIRSAGVKLYSESKPAESGINRKEASSVDNDIKSFWTDRQESLRQNFVGNQENNTHHHRKHLARCNSNSSSTGQIAVNSSSTAAAAEWADAPGIKKRMTKWSMNKKKDTRRSWLSRQKILKGAPRLQSIDAVAAVSGLLESEGLTSKNLLFSNIWMQTYSERTRNHEGFFDIDVYSLYEASSVSARRHPLDCTPWESRSVKQRFLYEQSLSLSRNWFGCLTETMGNKKINEPVCRPKSMEMPMLAGEWTEEWYKQPRIRPVDSLNACGTIDCEGNASEEESWEDTPQCGKIKNVNLKIGERISRVTPDLTSSLRRSRWRKKHFPQGTFPYK